MTERQGIHPIRMPKWGLSMQEGTLRCWNVEVGQRIAIGAPLCEIETAKITNEFESPAGGVVARLLVSPDDVVPIGSLIAVLAEGDGDAAAIDALVAAEAAAEMAAVATPQGPAMKRIGTGTGSLAYLEAGGPSPDTVIFLHGYGGSHTNWTLNQGALANRTRTLTFDLPGHGASDRSVGDASAAALAQIVQNAVDALELQRIHVVAHSFGAAVAMHMVGARPALYRSATLIAPLGLGAPPNRAYVESYNAAERKRDMKPVMEMLFADPALLSREMVNDALHALRDPEARATLVRIAGAMPSAGEDLRACLGELPTQILWGDRDAIVVMPADLPARLGTRLHLIRGAGHMPHVEKAPETNALIESFVRDHE